MAADRVLGWMVVLGPRDAAQVRSSCYWPPSSRLDDARIVNGDRNMWVVGPVGRREDGQGAFETRAGREQLAQFLLEAA